jgi:hypothetical protein
MESIVKSIAEFIEKNYPEERVTGMLDEEILEWSDWEEDDEDYENEYDWYKDHNNNEAEDEVIKVISEDVKKNFQNIPKEVDLEDIIKDKFQILS